MKKTIMIIAAVLFLTGCGNNEKEQANQLIEAAKVHFEQGALDAARADIDSLRKQFPNVVEARKAALQLHQEIELKAAQDELAATDSLLQITNQELDALQNQVDQHKKALKATPEELTKLTTTRIKRDSIRTQFETLGAKIRYIRQKQKEY
jgi:response regulator RpfG family c-di-GMP phosphodiesterase